MIPTGSSVAVSRSLRAEKLSASSLFAPENPILIEKKLKTSGQQRSQQHLGVLPWTLKSPLQKTVSLRPRRIQNQNPKIMRVTRVVFKDLGLNTHSVSNKKDPPSPRHPLSVQC